ncbi:hypothetical protein FACS189456_4460 [Bacteroidia bacterium]|nr:hypothetical protein FACS189456_4460 [Bacteroidia bacterium]
MNTRNITIIISIVLTIAFYQSVLASVADTKTIWAIGAHDNSAAGLALAPDKYNDFLAHDFGWEDKYFIIGYSVPEKDFPYILPGPDDNWGGTGATSGFRTHVINLLFNMKSAPDKGNWKLILDILDTDSRKPPLFKVSLNGHSWKQALPAGGGDESLSGNYDKAIKHSIEIPIEAGIVKEGGNHIELTNIEGSWLIFDDIRLEAPSGAKLGEINQSAYIRKVEPANYQLPDAQPLLVDVEHLSGNPIIEIRLDKKTILTQKLEQGRYIIEAPMPVVKSKTKSNFAVFVDNELIADGNVLRSPQKIITPADYIDTRIGAAHSRWMIAPGPWMPFSMVKLSPDNQNAGWQAGYQPTFESIGTFSHIHEWTMGGLGMMPVNGKLKTNIGDQSSLVEDATAYRSAIDKSSEEAPVGYYKVRLTDYNITAELTATSRCGFHRYTYLKGKDSRIMIDLKIPCEYQFEVLESSIRQVGARRIEGYSKQQSKYVWSDDANQDYTLFFVIEFDSDITKFGVFETGAFAEFNTTDHQVVQARSAISYVDLNGAYKNLKEEIATPFGWNFDAIRDNQRAVWNDILGRIKIQTNDRREKIRFYTNMYRAYCRNAFSDVDGRWVDATEKIQQFNDPDAIALGCDAFWNTFWNLNQLWNLATPEWSSRWVKSQLAMYDANGWLAKGPAGMEYIPVMVGEHEIPLMVSTYQMGIRNYDAQHLFEAVKKMQTTLPQRVGDGYAGNRDLDVYLQYHYVPADKGRFSNTLEYAYDDWTVSQLAKSLGKEADYKTFADRGTWWRNAIDTETGYARLKYSDGKWEKDFDPFKSGANHHYVEGNAWQLTFFVPQDVPALANMIGKDNFIKRLTWGFEASEPWRYNAPGDQYWDFPVVQGNQQSMHFAFLFNWVGQPWQTQRWSRSIIDRYYGYDIANAYLGDEDQGQMSAWFVMAAIGLFQTDGGCNAEPVYEIASPLFDKIVIDLQERFGRGKEFVIKANNVSRKNKYVQSAKLNGKPLHSFKFPAKLLLNGGSLELEMGEKPDYLWGIEK